MFYQRLDDMKLFLFGMIAAGLVTGCQTRDGSQEAATAAHPNIVIIYMDDLGYGDVSAYGATALHTPNIDQLAHGGIQFTNGYATSATCTPSRFALMTGIYPWRNKDARIIPGTAPLLNDTALVTLHETLKQAAYNTEVVVKWHLVLRNGNVD